MFGRLGRLVTGYPWWVIGLWVVTASALVLLAPGLDEVTTGDQGSFLPDGYESAQAQRLAEQAFPEQTATGALMVLGRTDGAALTPADLDRIADVAQRLSDAGIARVARVTTSPEAVSPDGTVQLAQVALDGELNDPAVSESVGVLRERAVPLLGGSGLEVGVTGDAAMIYDSGQAFLDAERVVALVTIGLVIGLLLLIFRSPVAALLPVLAVTVVLATTSSLIAAIYKALDIQTDQDLPVLLTVVLYGIGTDYTLFLLFRYRERLRAADPPEVAITTAVTRVGPVIFSAASVVIIAFLALLFASLGLFTSVGPAMAIGVAVMALAVLTLIPAVVRLIGPRVFWPSRSWQRPPQAALPRAAGQRIARRPGLAAGLRTQRRRHRAGGGGPGGGGGCAPGVRRRGAARAQPGRHHRPDRPGAGRTAAEQRRPGHGGRPPPRDRPRGRAGRHVGARGRDHLDVRGPAAGVRA